MKQLNKQGLTLIELLVSVVIFSMLIIPISTQFVSSLKAEKVSKTKQYETEYTESIMEYFKNTALKDVPDASMGASDGYMVSKDTNNVINPIYTYGKTGFNIGSNKNTKYKVVVECDPNAYSPYDAVKNKTGYKTSEEVNGSIIENNKDYKGNLNDVKLPNAVNINTNYAAVLKEEMSNYDSQAADDTLMMKAAVLKKNNEVRYQQWLNGADWFKGDTLEKSTSIQISKSSTPDAKGNYIYTVTAKITYQDDHYLRANAEAAYKNEYKNCNVTYTIFEKKFVDENGNALTKDKNGTPIGAPCIYIMYNQYVTNGAIKNDTITIDSTNLSNSEIDKFKVYLIRNNASDANVELYTTKDKKLLQVIKATASKFENGVASNFEETCYYLDGKKIACDPVSSEFTEADLQAALDLKSKSSKASSSMREYISSRKPIVKTLGTAIDSIMTLYSNMYNENTSGGVNTISWNYDMGSAFPEKQRLRLSDDTPSSESESRIYKLTVTLSKKTSTSSSYEKVMTLVSDKEGK